MNYILVFHNDGFWIAIPCIYSELIEFWYPTYYDQRITFDMLLLTLPGSFVSR